MARNPNLPDELLIEIFSVLPAKSIGRCRCLSRSWRSQLSESQFLNLHFTRKPHQETLLLITENNPGDHSDFPKCSINTISYPMNEESVVKEISVPNLSGEVVGSVNGLVLILDERGEMLFLMNPVTTEYISIPAIPPHLYPPWNLVRRDKIYGFGYDSSTKDYKIVMFANGLFFYSTSIYSVKTGRWVRKYNYPVNYVVPKKAFGALLDGALHWFANHHNLVSDDLCEHSDSDDSCKILAFDLGSEEFRLVPGPTHTNGFSDNCRAYILRGCLCIAESASVVKAPDFVVQAWMMNGYGIRESWTNLNLYQGISPSKLLCYNGVDEVLVVDTRIKELIVYNVKCQTRKRVILGGTEVVTDGCVFVESLVSPKHLSMPPET